MTIKMQVLKLTLVFCLVGVSMASGKIAGDFVRESLKFQLELAKKLLVKLPVSSVYIYDSVDYFTDGVQRVNDGIRYIEKNNRVATLSVAAQRTVPNANTYKQFMVNVDNIHTDEIGVRVDKC